MDILCTADMCPVILNATCVFYEGGTLMYTGITTNDNLQTALQKIDAKFGDAMVGYTFTNGVYQSVAGAPVGLGGSLTANTSIGGNYTLTFIGNVQAAKHITTGGNASQFVKGDGTLDSNAYQVAGDYITALTGDVIAAGPGSAAASLAVVNSNPGTYGSGTRIPVVTVDTKGRVTALTTTAINVPSGILSFVGDVYGSGTTGSTTTLTLTNVNSNVYNSNTFLKFKVNAKGLVTGAALVTHVDIEGVLGYVPVPETRTITINGIVRDLQTNAVFTLPGGGSVTNVSVNPGTGIAASVLNPTTAPVISITNTAPDQVVSIASGSGINVTGTYPNFTVAATNAGTVTAVTASAPLSSSGGTTPNITISQASGSTDGYLSSTDWNTFNGKQAAGNYITALTGEATASGPGSATVTLSTPAVTSKLLTGVNITGGSVVATDTILEAFGKVQNQINGLIGGSIYKGTWNASTNTPTITSGVGTTGWYYIVSVPGTTNIDGITDWNLGDWIIFDGTAWQQVDNTDAVVSVNGYTGAVSLVSSDVPEGLTNLYYTPARARTAISITTTGTSGAATYDDITGVFNIPNYTTDLSGYVPNTRTLTINGTTYDLSANRSWTVAGSMPTGGTAGQILAKIDATDYNTQWIDNYATQVKNEVKLGAALTKGTPVYVSSADGTNMIVSASSNTTEATSSKTFGLLETGGVLNDFVKCVTYGLLAGLDTSAANAAGDPVWLGPNGTLLYGLVNKPYAPAHMVYIGVVTRKQSNNGEIFINVQNGFEMDELHNVSAQNPANNAILAYNTTTSLWEKNTVVGVLGYTPANGANYLPLTGGTLSGTLGIATNTNTLSINSDGLTIANTEWGSVYGKFIRNNTAIDIWASGTSSAGLLALSLDPYHSTSVFSTNLTATSFVKSGGTASQILAADGSVITAGTGITITGGTISSSATGGVSSFNTRTGAVTLTSGDVTGALTYTPANDTLVVKLAGSQTITGQKTFSASINGTSAVFSGAVWGQTGYFSNTTADNALIIYQSNTSYHAVTITATGGSALYATGSATIVGTANITSQLSLGGVLSSSNGGAIFTGTPSNTIQNAGSPYIYLNGSSGATPSYTTLQQGLNKFDIYQFDGSSWVNNFTINRNGNVGIGNAGLAALNKTLTVEGTIISQTTVGGGNYNESFRGNRTGNGYAAIAIGGAYGSVSGTGAGQWTFAATPSSTATPYALDFDYAGSTVIKFGTGGNLFTNGGNGYHVSHRPVAGATFNVGYSGGNIGTNGPFINATVNGTADTSAVPIYFNCSAFSVFVGYSEQMRLVSGGTLYIGGGIVQYYGSWSDRTLKENLEVIANPLDKISKLTGYTFDWTKDSPYRNNPAIGERIKDAGLIAQDVEEVLPEVVTEKDKKKHVNYNGVTALHTEGIKELIKENQELKNRLSLLEERLALIESKLL